MKKHKKLELRDLNYRSEEMKYGAMFWYNEKNKERVKDLLNHNNDLYMEEPVKLENELSIKPLKPSEVPRLVQRILDKD